MRIIKQRLSGNLLNDGQRTALRLSDDEETLAYLVYAYVTHGPAHHILPSVLLDDWGSEIKNLDLYRWIRENGLHFPRAELFGVSPDGTPAQYFLRDLDLLCSYPTYASADKSLPIAHWMLLDAVLVPDARAGEPVAIATPDFAEPPLREASVRWYRVEASQSALDFIPQTHGNAG